MSFFSTVTKALCRRPNLARALLRSVASGEPLLTARVAAFHTRMSELIIIPAWKVQLESTCSSWKRWVCIRSRQAA